MDNKENCNLENNSIEPNETISAEETVETNDISPDEVVIDGEETSGEKSADGASHKSHHHSSHHAHHSHHSHHSRHSHHSHHSSHHEKRRRKSHSNSYKKKFKISAKVGWASVIVLFLLLVSFIIVVSTTDIFSNDFSDENKDQQSSNALVVEVQNREGLLVKQAVNKYLLTDMLNPSNANVLLSTFSNGEGRPDEQVPVVLKLSAKEGIVLLYKIDLAQNDTFENASTYYIEGTLGVCELNHLFTNTTYYYRVTAYFTQGTEAVVGHFKTADTPRVLSIDGLSNVRDIGNWRTDSGERIKQGLLIRGSEMDAAVESGYCLTNEGLVDMLDMFGIKTDMDLRAQTTSSKDALGPNVDHKYYDMVLYNAIFTNEGKEKVRMVFADLANADNYPIYMHCTYGRDRTGIICYILEALLGVSRGDCLIDYGLSNVDIANIKVVEEGLKAYAGDTLKEQAESYLLSCGISEYQINSIRNIFLGD